MEPLHKEKEMDEEGRKGSILIVDDTLPTIDLIRTVLEGQGYDVMVATSGEQTIKRAGLKTPDLILLDVLMPGMDGFETCRRLKAEESTRDIPVIFMTALGATESKVKGFELGAVDYVTKPIEVEEVLARVRTHLSLHTMRLELEVQNRRLQQEIQERQQAEEEIRKLNAELEQRVEERTGELREANEQLKQKIEERKRTEEALRESEGKYRLLAENVVDVIWSCDMDIKFTYVSPSAKRLRGFTVQEAMEQTMDEVLTPQSLELAMNIFAEEMNVEGSMDKDLNRARTIELEQYCSDGSTIWTENTLTFLRDEQMRPIGVLGVTRDISERKRAEAALKESEERYRMAIESGNDGVAIVEGDRHIYVNQTFAEIFGYERSEEIVGKPVSAMLHPDDRERVTRIIHHRQEGRPAPSRYEFKGLRKDGKEIHVEVSAIRTIYRGKSVSLSFHRDVTQRKQLEAQLQQAQKMEAIGTLAGGIAHDFNNILAVIVGCSELALLNKPEDPRANRLLKQILNAANRATDLVQQILIFSRQRAVEKRPLQVSLIAKEALKMLRASLPSTIRIEQNIAPDSGMALADPTQIHQVLMNLCTNAAHAMRDHGGVLEVSLSNMDIDSGHMDDYADISPGPYLRLSVSDTGHGMNREVLERIFDPYFTTKEPGEGTGLGLAVVHGIVQACGGAVRVRSEPGKGTNFEILLPRIDHPAALENTGHRPEDLPRGHERILFVDDEQVIVDVTKHMLEYLGYEVLATTSSIGAFRLFRDQPDRFDLVITDLTMPNMTGEMLAKEIMKVRQDIPIIVCTGFSERIAEAKAKALGVREYIAKPVVIHDLAKKVRESLNKKE
jgi:PAS domain S-box-containing protein